MKRTALIAHIAISAPLLAALAPAQAADAADLWPGATRQLEAARAGKPDANTLVLKAPDARPAYLLTAPCCDLFNLLFDDRGQRICAPSGGFAGHGDGQCPAWVNGAIDAARHSKPPAPAASTIAR